MKRASLRFSPPNRRAFTLVELIVSMGLLALLVILVAQLTGSATTTTTSSRKHMDADSQARMIFDRMADDFAKMARRKDLDCIFYKNAASASGINDAMFFYSEAPAFSNVAANKSTVSLVGYRINSATLQLERLGEALTWDGSTSNDATSGTSNATPGSVVFLTYAGAGTPAPASTLAGNWSATIGTAANNYTDGVDSDYNAIGEQTYRLEINFLLSDGTTSTKPVTNPAATTNNLAAGAPPTASSDSSAGYTSGSRWYDTTAGRGYVCTSAAAGAAVWAPIGTRDISAIIVAIAILDNTSRVIISDASKMVAALPDAVDGAPIEQTWVASAYLTNSGLPVAAASQIRIYQRYFYLPQGTATLSATGATPFPASFSAVIQGKTAGRERFL